MPTSPATTAVRPWRVDLVRLSGRQVPVGDLRIPVHELGHGGARLELAPRVSLLEQLAELDLRRPLCLACLPQPDLSARQWVGPGIDLSRAKNRSAVALCVRLGTLP